MPKRTPSRSVDVFVVPVGDPRFDEVRALEGASVEVAGWRGADVAWKLIDEGREQKTEAVR